MKTELYVAQPLLEFCRAPQNFHHRAVYSVTMTAPQVLICGLQVKFEQVRQI